MFQELQDTELTDYLTGKEIFKSTEVHHHFLAKTCKTRYDYVKKHKIDRKDAVAIFWNTEIFEKLGKFLYYVNHHL